jgi:hypothetical protein
MTQEQGKQVLRLPRKHSRDSGSPPDPERGGRLARMQSPRAAITASLIVIILFSVAWALLSSALGRVFPWMTLVMALLIGLAVRRAGKGMDWRFPVIAASAAVFGSLVGNIVVAASTTAAEFGTGTLTVLRAVTEYTWPVFFSEVMTGADVVYAIGAAGIAAFYANRRLTRSQYASYRMWRESRHGESE